MISRYIDSIKRSAIEDYESRPKSKDYFKSRWTKSSDFDSTDSDAQVRGRAKYRSSLRNDPSRPNFRSMKDKAADDDHWTSEMRRMKGLGEGTTWYDY